MELFKVLGVRIVSSQMTGACSECTTLMTVHGDFSLMSDYDEIQYIKLITDGSYFNLFLTETSFKANGALQHMIDAEDMYVFLKNSTLVIEGGVSFRHTLLTVQNVLIQCSISKMAQLTSLSGKVVYTCDPACEGESKYSLQAGRIMMKGSKQKLNSFIPSCYPCPLGAKCDSGIQALPNYWGQEIHDEPISMFRCPDGYCCQGDETCDSIDSCNIGRMGTLCGICEKNLAESIFTPECVPTKSCQSGLVLTLFISAAMVYAVFLLSLSTIKNKLTCILKKVKYGMKKCYMICKERCRKDKSKERNSKKQASVDDSETDESGIKYMQILFYCVQDSKLFTIYLPQLEVKTENVVVKFLELSPLIMETYVEATGLCIVISSAIIKVVFELLFRFLVMILFCLTYLVQRFLSQYIIKVLLEKLKVKLVQAFLLTVLLSYQKKLIGTFTLVQCVNIQGLTVLFIQASVECYTWWQIGILIYILICVVPLLFVLSHLPFCVNDGKLSVKSFILACIFPLPVIIWCQIINFYNKAATNTDPIENIPLSDVGIEGKNVDVLTKTDDVLHSQEFPDGSCITARVHEIEICHTFEIDPLFENKTTLTRSSTKSHIEASLEIQVASNETDKTGSIVEFSEQAEALNAADLSDISEGKNIEQKEEGKLAEALVGAKRKDVGSCEEIIVETLQKHYKCLSLFGFRFTWLGVHMLYRLALVACRTFITEPVKRLYAMSALVLAMTAANAFIKPYKDQKANITATISYIANLCIAGLNLVKANYVAYGCNTGCDDRDKVIEHMVTFENALLLYAPFTAIGLWVVYKGIQRVVEKCK